MGRCSCASGCDCAIVDSDSITWAGTGSPGDPYVGQVVVDNDLCCEIQDCIGNAVKDGLEYTPGGICGGEFAVKISADAGNDIVFGGDDGIYASSTGVTSVLDTDSVDLTLALGVLSADVKLGPTFPGAPPGCNGLISTLGGLVAPPQAEGLIVNAFAVTPDVVAAPGAAGVVNPVGVITPVVLTNTSCYPMVLDIKVSQQCRIRREGNAAVLWTEVGQRVRFNGGPFIVGTPFALIGRLGGAGQDQFWVDGFRNAGFTHLEAIGTTLAPGAAILVEFQFYIQYVGAWSGVDAVTTMGARTTIIGIST